MSTDTVDRHHFLRYHSLGVLCWLYPVGYPRTILCKVFRGGQLVTQMWCLSVRCPWSFCPILSRLTFRPHHADDPRQNDAAWVDFAGPSQGADGRCSRLDAGRGRVLLLESMS